MRREVESFNLDYREEGHVRRFAGLTRAQIAPLMERFLSLRKVKKIARGVSGLCKKRAENDWGYSGGSWS